MDLIDFGKFSIEVHCFYREEAFLEPGSYVPNVGDESSYILYDAVDQIFIPVYDNILQQFQDTYTDKLPIFDLDGCLISDPHCLVCSGSIGPTRHMEIVNAMRNNRRSICRAHVTKPAKIILSGLTVV